MAAAAQLACLLEVNVEKPGNVTPTRSFGDMRYEDFLRSTVAIGPEMARAGQRSVGETIRAAIEATRCWTQANTNLGIVLLFAPLAKATLGKGTGLRDNLQNVLSKLTMEDARAAYAAIIIPPALRNAAYRYIARNRYRWFGQSEQCMLPKPEHKHRFL